MHQNSAANVPDVLYRRFAPTETELLAEFLTNEDWPYHGAGAPEAATVREHVAAGDYDNDRTRTFWMVTGAETIVGLIRLMDLGDNLVSGQAARRVAVRHDHRRFWELTQAGAWPCPLISAEMPGGRMNEV